MNHLGKLSCLALTATLATATTASAQSTSVFTGVEAGEDSYTVYGGAVTALDGDINSSGVLLRFSAAYGEYEYDTVGVPGGKVDIDGSSADLMVGYQWLGAAANTSVFLGVDYRDNSLSPSDPNNSTNGDETGAKAQVEVFSNSTTMPGTSLIASYSTAYETYFVRGRAGFAIGALHAGPEVLFLGNEEYDAYKLGAFLGGIRLGETSSLTLNAGYTESEGSGSGDGAYAGMSLSFQF